MGDYSQFRRSNLIEKLRKLEQTITNLKELKQALMESSSTETMSDEEFGDYITLIETINMRITTARTFKLQLEDLLLSG